MSPKLLSSRRCPGLDTKQQAIPKDADQASVADGICRSIDTDKNIVLAIGRCDRADLENVTALSLPR
jgi:hypothetical protein